MDGIDAATFAVTFAAGDEFAAVSARFLGVVAIGNGVKNSDDAASVDDVRKRGAGEGCQRDGDSCRGRPQFHAVFGGPAPSPK